MPKKEVQKPALNSIGGQKSKSLPSVRLGVQSLKPKDKGQRAKSASQTFKRPSTQTDVANPEPRRLPLPRRVWHKPWTWARNLPAPPRKPLPKARHILVEAVRVAVRDWKVFGGIILVYGLLSLVLVSGTSGSANLVGFKQALGELFTGTVGQVQTALTSFVVLVGSSNRSSTETSGLYQAVLLIVVSLALIWAFRQAIAKHKQRIRDPFYQGMYPLIPFVLVLLVLSVQLLPIVVGGFLYTVVVNNGIAADIIEKLIFMAIFAALALWSLRMLTTSIFALYIVTLPGMTPVKALRSAGELVYKRRLLIWRKLLFLPLVLLLLAALIELPLILFWVSAAYWVFFMYSMLATVVFHGYLYVLYRKLL